MTISIITPVHNHPELISQYELAVQGAQVILIDNASDPEAAERWAAMAICLPRSVYVRNEENRAFCESNNQGYARATGDIVLFLNNDIVAKVGWLDDVARDVQGGALYGPEMGQLIAAGQPMIYVGGWCVAATRADWDRMTPDGLLGPWDEVNYPGHYHNDVDLSWRARFAGLRLVRTDWSIEHLGNITSKSVPGAYDAHPANRATFERRYVEWREANHA